MTVTYIVYSIRRYGQAVLSILLFGSMLHDADHSLYNVINVGEVTFAVAVVEYPDSFTFHKLVGETEVGHVGAACRPINGKEAEPGRGDVVELAVGMSHQLIAFLGGCIKRHGIVYLVICRIRHLLVAAIDG